eukprot:GHVO01036317.1.p1 GENE.GHVO01036317.1~~GHVO01036317.1.p1  ORF type:complete len:233 (-),score=17.99 GHVO01036317.1:98-796(-)
MKDHRPVWLLVSLLLNCELTLSVKVDLSMKGLKSVPENINPNVTRLDIFKNQITEIRKSDFNDKYPDLTFVNMGVNKLWHIERGCFKGTKLTQMFLSSSLLSTIPDFREVSGTLIKLDLGYNQIAKITPDDVNYLTELNILVLRFNPLVSLPDLQVILPSLSSLVIEGVALACCCNIAWLKRTPPIADLQIDTNPCISPSKWTNSTLQEITEEMMLNQPCESSAGPHLCREI